MAFSCVQERRCSSSGCRAIQLDMLTTFFKLIRNYVCHVLVKTLCKSTRINLRSLLFCSLATSIRWQLTLYRQNKVQWCPPANPCILWQQRKPRMQWQILLQLVGRWGCRWGTCVQGQGGGGDGGKWRRYWRGVAFEQHKQCGVVLTPTHNL